MGFFSGKSTMNSDLDHQPQKNYEESWNGF